MVERHRLSPRREARIAGVLYLLSILIGLTAMILIHRKLEAQGDRANLIAGVLYTGLTVLLWDLFRPLRLSTTAALFSIAGCWFPQPWFHWAHITDNLFFGVYCLSVGYLAVRSRFFPNTVGVLMTCAGVCWMTTSWPLLDHALSPYAGIVGLFGEGAFMGYLLVRGLDERQWREQAGIA